MGLFSFTQEIAMDLGTANTIITTNGKIVVDEPSVVALDRRTDKMIAVGDKAKMMHEKTHENIRTIRPLRDGVIADFYACEQMIRGLIKMVNNRNRLFSPSLRMVIGGSFGQYRSGAACRARLCRACRRARRLFDFRADGCCHRYRYRCRGSRRQHDC